MYRMWSLCASCLCFTFSMMCAAQEQSAAAWPDITFQHKAPLLFAVTRIDVNEVYLPPLTTPNVEHLFPVPPASAVRAWSRDRLRNMGGRHRLVVKVIDASVIEEPLETKSGIMGLLTNDQSEKYNGTLKVRLEIIENGTGALLSWVEATATQSRTVPENASVLDRETVFFEITESLIQSLDRELEKQVSIHLQQFMV